jgi:hypothetical protein
LDVSAAKPLSNAQLEAIAGKHGISAEAVETLVAAMAGSRGRTAQFNHPELGGLGQWMAGGMLMIGDMSNSALKAKVEGVCRDVADAIAQSPATPDEASRGGAASSWWPVEFGVPASVGAQNAMRYAFFPDKRRLVIEEGGRLSVYDTGEHLLTGFGQQQGADQTLTFSTASGRVPIDDLFLIGSRRKD